MRSFLLAVVVLAGVPQRENAAESVAKNSPVDQAVERALEFLHNTQDRGDGAWLAQGRKNVAITSLAVMAFLAAGHVPGEGRYGDSIDKGVRWVLKQQRPNGLIASEGNPEMYHHGIATLMLAEVSGMTDRELAADIRAALKKAVAVILKAQRRGGDDRGGWRYHVAPVEHPRSDISVTGWQILALRGAKNLGCDVPPEAIAQAVDYIQRCQDRASGGFRYTVHQHVTIPCTGTSILALELCGKERHHSAEVLRAGAFLIRQEHLPRWGQPHFSYGIYYGAQATFQLGDNYWSVYRPRLHEVLLRHQDANGSWNAEGPGPVYCTAMAVLALTVEYRFLPIYQRDEAAAER